MLYEVPAEYQKQEMALKELVHVSYRDYLEGFQQLKSYYQKHKLLRQGIVFTPLFDRVVKENDPDFLSGMINHYIKIRDFDHAFRLLERFKETGLPPELVSEEQKMIAKYFAKRDLNDNTSDQPWEKLRSYVVADKWYKDFRCSYKRAWLSESGWKIKYWPLLWKK